MTENNVKVPLGFRPINNYKQHLEEMKDNGHPQKNIDYVKSVHEEYYRSIRPTRPKKVKEPLPDPRLHPCIMNLRKEYYDKLELPPFDVLYAAYKTAGYPRWFLEDMIEKNKKKQQWREIPNNF